MKINFDIGIRRVAEERRQKGIVFYAGPYEFTIRTRYNFEEDGKRYWWTVERNGLYESAFLPLPRNWCIDGYHNLKSYAEAVGFDLPIDWVLDEFDSSFNKLAICSLRYHLDYSVACNEGNRERYEDIMQRLGERSPRFTDEEMAVLNPPGWTIEDDFKPVEGGFQMRQPSAEKSAIYDAYEKRERAYHARQQQARHDFIDILPGLWS